VVSENPHLYYEIQAGTNPAAGAAGVFARALDRLVEAISAGDEDAFVAVMNGAHRYFSRPPRAEGT